MCKLYIFDFDGMLVDTIYDSIHCVNIALKKFKKPTYNLNLDSIIYKDFRSFLHENGWNKNSPIYKYYLKIYNEYEKPNTKPYDGICEVLRVLNQDNNITLAICSNKDEKELKKNVDKFFSDIDFKYISGHTPNAKNKPDPKRLNDIIKKEDIPKENVTYFGDKDVDIEVSKNANIKMVLVTYGQGNIEDYSNSYPSYIIDSPYEILKIKL